MFNPVVFFRKIFKHVHADAMYRNSLYLILSTGFTAFFGFFFWIIVARLFNVTQVGIATTLISIMNFLLNLCGLGLGTGVIYFLPKLKNKNDNLNVAMNLTFVISLVISIIFVLLINVFAPKLTFLQSNIIFIISFTIFIISASLNNLVDSIFTAYRSTFYVLLKNIIISVLKCILPIIFLEIGGFGIFSAVGTAILISLLVGYYILHSKYNYSFKLSFNKEIIRNISKYSFLNYLVVIINMLPSLILPILIINKINAQESAYYYIAFMIANLLYIIPLATSQMLFVEGSYDNKKLYLNLIKVFKIMGVLLFPSIIILFFLGNYILLAFGKSYSSESLLFLRLLLISSVFLSGNYILSAILKVKNRLFELIAINATGTVMIIILSYLLINQRLYGIGLANIVSQAALLVVYLFFLRQEFITFLKSLY